MKFFPVLILCALICLTIPAGAGEILKTGVSSVNATTENPLVDVSVYISDARAAVAERNWTRTLFLTTRGLAWYPDDPELHCLQGYSLRKMGQYAKSVDLVSEGIQLDPEPVRYANRGYGYLALGNYPAALSDAEAGIALNASYTTNYAVKALALQGMGRNAEAIAAIDSALALDPESAHYWHVKGTLISAGGNCTGSREALERSLAIDPDYDLPYPDFTGARGNLETLSITCSAVTPAPSPAKTPTGAIAVPGIMVAIIVFYRRR
jgi:tetratricopeptide (TPR) repeat protein